MILVFFSGFSFGGEYFAKIEPIEVYHVKSAVSGQVVKIDRESEARESSGKILVKIDDHIDRVELDTLRQKLRLSDEQIKLLKERVASATKVQKIAKDSYNRVKNLQSYTKVQKDAKLSSYLNSKNSLNSIKSNLIREKITREDLKLKIEALEDKIAKKSIRAKEGVFIYKIYPNVGDVVGVGAKLYDGYDLNHAKLTIFIDRDEVEGIKGKSIYIDGKKTEYKISKLWSVADSKNISSYRAEIIIDKPERFSKLVKVEFK